jgi:hypothetical protein
MSCTNNDVKIAQNAVKHLWAGRGGDDKKTNVHYNTGVQWKYSVPRFTLLLEYGPEEDIWA